MKILCKYLGGSISYGLDTPLSDRDERYLFLNTELSQIIGLDRHEHQSKQSNIEDTFGWELRHFLNLLKRGNTMCLETIYNDKWITITKDFEFIQSYRKNLIDSDCLYKCLKGYCHSERRLVLGERTGVLGGKRREHLEKYGYSYKNAVQFLRLCLCGSVFFQEGYFPVNVNTIDTRGLLFDIKTHPEKYSKDVIISLMSEYEKIIDESYSTIKVKYKYDVDIANYLCYQMYMPILENFSEDYFSEHGR